MATSTTRRASTTGESLGYWERDARFWRRKSLECRGRARQDALERLWWAEGRMREILQRINRQQRGR